jgi:hypothetical protein
MKKIIMITMTFFLALTILQAQTKKNDKAKIAEAKKEIKTERVALHKLEGTTVSEIAKDNFTADFSNVSNVHWKRNSTFDEASFMKGGKQMTAYYDIDGNLVGSTRAATLNELPSKAVKEISIRYKNYSVGPIIFFKDNESNATDMILYGVQFDDADTWLVELTKGADRIVVQANKDGEVSYFSKL